ncbi:MAG: (d)CMP kinase [Lentisphaeria bacterium]|nr:(d)CMP kinase [Lentisphaeria bacterium]NLZ59291.1 (d)CMP kinase [Lentisphaerota bacterium]
MNHDNFLQIAIDGPAAAGKSTQARMLAEKLGGYYINTGDMYRALAHAALQAGIDPEKNPEKLLALLPEWELEYQLDKENQPQLYFNGKPIAQDKLRNPQVTAIVSQVARIPQLREWMLDKQRRSRKLGLVIMEGRDIGSVVLPEAKFKFFITASPMERARRRLAQSSEVSSNASLEQVAEELQKRDFIDSNRELAPLRQADDAIKIVTDGMSKEEVSEMLADMVRKELP